MKKIDLDNLRMRIRKMTRNTLLFIVLKEELSDMGYWRNKPRGNPSIKNFGDNDARKKK